LNIFFYQFFVSKDTIVVVVVVVVVVIVVVVDVPKADFQNGKNESSDFISYFCGGN